MGISKTNNGSYRLRVYIPDEVQGKLGLGRRFEKRLETFLFEFVSRWT